MKGQAGALIIILLIIGGMLAWGYYTGWLKIPGVKPPVIRKWKGLAIYLDYPKELISKGEGKIAANLSNEGASDAVIINATLRGLSTQWRVDGTRFKEKSKRLVGDIKPGKQKLVEWKVEAPSVIERVGYPFEIEVGYGYMSTFQAVIRVVSRGHHQDTNDTGEILNQVTTEGPLKVNLVPTEFVADGKIEVRVEIWNVGGGEVREKRVKIESVKGIDCPKTASFENNLANITCHLELPKFEKYIHHEVKLRLPYYEYIISETGKITVTPPEETT